MRCTLSCIAISSIAGPSIQTQVSVVIPACCVAGERTKPMLSPIIRYIRDWQRYGRDVQELSRLSDRELADIGITRCDIRRIARGQSR
jgi:uncharacterized protein YjiS (DUF1127 family)